MKFIFIYFEFFFFPMTGSFNQYKSKYVLIIEISYMSGEWIMMDEHFYRNCFLIELNSNLVQEQEIK